jgi:hypothetical protein
VGWLREVVEVKYEGVEVVLKKIRNVVTRRYK